VPSEISLIEEESGIISDINNNYIAEYRTYPNGQIVVTFSE
jgi:hypothetical protein